jgi:hypothetical protein
MRRLISLALLTAIVLVSSLGCEHKTTTKTTETIKGPGGTTEIEHKDTVKKSGENAPNP